MPLRNRRGTTGDIGNLENHAPCATILNVIQGPKPSRMNVLGEPVERDLSAHTFLLRRLIHFCSHCRKLGAETDVVHEPRNLLFCLPAVDSTGNQIGQRRERFPIDGAIRWMVFWSGRDRRALARPLPGSCVTRRLSRIS